ncbi:hypothetical protein CDO52_08605 [Nocardiopsis gilva YIM 90087]|uniref:Aminoglycoside phosphotransferase domain-containing protein n=1 Tax=Nocardiopsis gilva YIM 90087 TaxID=1235441 RepID=A0A223S3X2_9ACTN|nr:hypothetical protein [Nocardiopsis gilva]ASU82834.1 hypothetical protein CDO52_08605 [Nocardiopsis gilva YIM 90087]
MSEVIVSDYGTRLTRTRIVRTDYRHFAWLVRNGADHPSGSGVNSLAGVENLGLQGECPTRLVVPREDGGWLRYEAPGQTPAFYLVFSDDAEARRTLHAAVSGVGQALRALHDSPVNVPVRASPPGIARLEDWLRNKGTAVGDSSRLFTEAVRILGEKRLSVAQGWIGELLANGDGSVLLHGAPSLGCLVPSPVRHKHHVLLTGEELSQGAPELDLGWILGEFAELRMLEAHGRMCLPTAIVAETARQLKVGYARPIDRRLTGMAATLRVLLHAHDAACYHVWDESLLDYLVFVAELVDGEGDGAQFPD